MNQQSSLSDMANVSYKGRINRINIVQVLLLLSMPKKFKEVLRTRLSGNKITWIETCLDQKNAKWKTTSNQGTLACYEDLPIITHLKILCNLFCVWSKHPFPTKSVASGVYTTFPQITQKILTTDTYSWLETIIVILGFLKIFTFRETITHFRTEGSNFQFQFWMDCVFPLMPIISSCKNSSCV